MAADVGWFRQTLSNISNEIEVINNLSELKIALTSVNTMQIKTLALNLDRCNIRLSQFVDKIAQLLEKYYRLKPFDRVPFLFFSHQIELGCHILEELLPCLEPAVLLNKYGVAMHRALAHPNETVKQVVLTEMCRAVKDSDLVSRMGDQQALLLSVVECVGHDNMSVAKIAISFLVWMGQTPSYLGTLLSPQLLQAFNAVKKKNETTRFRVFEVIVEVSAISSPGLEACHNSGLLTELLNETKQKSDILSIMKFFGNIAQFWPRDIFEKYSKVIGAIFEFSNSADANLAAIALERSAMWPPPRGRGDAMSSVMRKLNQLITSAPAEVRVRPLNTIANIIGLEVIDQTSELLQLTEKWYLSLSDANPTLSFMNICHLPFAELRLAGFLILQKMSIQVWGQKHVLNCPGLIEFLMDRDVEPTLECKTSKFQIVEFLVGSNTTETVFGEILYKRLVDFVRDGPCYVQALTEVAIEGAA
ncbi:26S proteasome non-ATPase regulatory subunit 5 [Nilaparvata lugens]|uniref:26S proteasome non-ATPase regulatory subunit 5 n=1 Tax=Nilaparvata lugens TaxID=108931 RepID=UPI00193EAC10|nr:26S proteasome non-ATPase regulatory subunit 5 [Nilaparvata lugens]